MDNKNRSANHHTVLSRRDALRAGTAAIAVTGLAGCSASPGGGSGDGSGDGSGGGSGAPGGFDYTQYLYDPDKIVEYDIYNDELTQSQAYFIYGQPKSIAENKKNFDEELYRGDNSEYNDGVEEFIGRVQDKLGIDFAEITNAVDYGTGSVVTVESEVDVINRLRENGFNEWDEDLPGDYDSYYTEGLETVESNAEKDGTRNVREVSRPAAVGVKENEIIYSDGDREPLLMFINAKSGEIDRYARANENSELVFEHIGNGDAVGGWALENPIEFLEFDTVVGNGFENHYNGENSEIKSVYVHENQDDVDTEDARESIEEMGSFEGANEYSVSQSGRATIVNAEYDTDELGYIL